MGGLYTALVVIVLVALGSFYLSFSEISESRNRITNLELSIEFMKKDIAEKDTALQSIQTKTEEKEGQEVPPLGNKTNAANGTIIPTAIIFEAESSPLLQPQTKIIVTIESVVKMAEGEVKLNIKAFSSQATSYSALEPRDFFEMVSLEGDNQRPVKSEGSFNSIPPKSAAFGSVMFKLESTAHTMILQIGRGTDIKFYEFNFDNKTYKETVIG